MSNRYWQPPGFELRPGNSRWLRLLAGIALGLSLLAVWLSALHGWASSLCSLLIIVLFVREMHGTGWTLAATRILCLCCAHGRWRLALDSGMTVSVSPCASSLLLPSLIVLRARVDASGEVWNIVLARDACARENWRLLQLNLRQTLADPDYRADSISG